MLRLLHLSDLHFGDHSRLKGRDPAEAGKSFHRALVETEPELSRTGSDKKLDLVIVTGDLAEVGKPKEFHQAHDFFRALAGELGIEHRRFVFCPGNHDISRPLCRKVAADQEIDEFDDQELRRRLDRVKLRFYAEFLARFYDTPTDTPLGGVAESLGHGGFVHDFPGLRLSIAALNSCEKESHRDEDHVGLLSEAQAKALMAYWQQGAVTRWLKIVAVHHNPTVTVPSNISWWRDWLEGQALGADQIAAWQGDVLGFEGRDRLKRIVEDCQVQLVLHGHHHAKDDHVWPWRNQGYGHVLSAGSLSLVAEKLPGTEPASFRLILLDPEISTLEAKSFVWVDWARTIGEVERGSFKPDPDGAYSQRLDLPADFSPFVQSAVTEETSGARDELAGFVRTFRTAFRGVYSRWDLATAGVTQGGGAGRPIAVGLDAMYVPLRLDSYYHPDYIRGGQVIEPDSLLRRTLPLAVRGAAGSGKTTWMRWVFRRLLDVEHALPLMLVLRDLARVWGESKAGSERSLEVFLDAWASEQIGSGWKAGHVRRLLEARSGPTPILLVDGWDELGPLGETVRAKLVGMMGLYPRMRVVASSRPYGEGRPSHAEGFEVLDLQPLSGSPGSTLESWGEIGQLAENFFRHCYLDEIDSKASSTQDFLLALARSPDAQALARTPLLLTMMLLISRSRPLPDKRHDLYEACIDNLLTARTERKEREGALLLHEQWRPDDSDERKRVVAALAHGLQDAPIGEGDGHDRRLVAVPRDQAELLLPEDWPTRHRRGFLAWLAGPAGLLIDRSDNTLTFAHLSFQEYLTAWHLEATIEGTRSRIELFRRQMTTSAWREVLLLWAARIDKQNPERIDEVVNALAESHPGLVLGGFIFADGLGSDRMYQSWRERFLFELSSPSFTELSFGQMARAWKASQQHGRRRDLIESLKDRLASAPWLACERLLDFYHSAFEPQRVTVTPLTATLLQYFDGHALTEATVAAARLLCGGPPLWPSNGASGFLQLWPASRRLIGLRLQSLIAAGAELRDLKRLPDAVSSLEAAPAPDDARVRGFMDASAAELAYDLAGNLSKGLATEFVYHWALHVADSLRCDVARELSRDLAPEMIRKFARSFGRESGRSIANSFRQDLVHGRARVLARQVASKLEVDASALPWLLDFIAIELLSLGRTLAPAIPDHHRNEGGNSLMEVFAVTCRLTTAPAASDTCELDRVLDKHGPSLHPVWPALARHLVHRSDAADRELLESLARDPEQVEDGPLRWGLRFIVRGDLMLHDGSFVALDALCDEMGLPHLPYLEDPPPTPDVSQADE